jgi:7-cyano-7-deazaguanine reductase
MNDAPTVHRDIAAIDRLGAVMNTPSKTIETFVSAASTTVSSVEFECKELTANCPVTMQPDVYTVVIHYDPRELFIETKSLKLYLWTFRNRGIFAEDIADEIVNHLFDAVNPFFVTVQLKQQARGGIVTTVHAEKWGDSAHDNE